MAEGQPLGRRPALAQEVLERRRQADLHSPGGKIFGRKLAPRISPNKTIEGVIGGLLLSVAIALAGALLIGTKAAQLPAVALVAVVVVLFSVVGDLFESLLKRHAGVKDSGNLIPGHGGLLDRMDSVLAALPVFVLGKEWLGF